MYAYIYGAVFLLGTTLAYFALKQYLFSRKIVSIGVKTEAEVIKFETYVDSDGKMFTPVFEYVDVSGAKKQFKSDVSSAKPSMKIGDKRQLIYNPNDNNEVKLVSYWGLYMWTIILLSLASPFLIIGGGYLLYVMV